MAEADVLARKINKLIADVRSERRSHLNNACQLVLWKIADAQGRDVAINNLHCLLFDVYKACEYFVNVCFDPAHYQANVVKFLVARLCL
jgi:hypothetical protein